MKKNLSASRKFKKSLRTLHGAWGCERNMQIVAGLHGCPNFCQPSVLHAHTQSNVANVQHFGGGRQGGHNGMGDVCIRHSEWKCAVRLQACNKGGAQLFMHMRTSARILLYGTPRWGHKSLDTNLCAVSMHMQKGVCQHHDQPRQLLSADHQELPVAMCATMRTVHRSHPGSCGPWTPGLT